MDLFTEKAAPEISFDSTQRGQRGTPEIYLNSGTGEQGIIYGTNYADCDFGETQYNTV